MHKIPKRSTPTLWRRSILTSIAALSLFLILSSTALAGSVKISDQAKVLDDDKVRNAASALQYPLSIYTVDNYDGSTNSFDQRSKKHVTSDSIVISISTNLKRVAINAGKNVPLTDSNIDKARKAFTNQYNNTNSDYTSATISCIDSLRNTLGTSNASTSTSKDGFNFLGLVGGCLIGLVILGALFYLIIRSRRKHHGVPPPPPYANPHYGQPYPPNNYGSNYGPHYDHHHDHHHGSRHSGGLNPLVAGGLGAAAGGLIGYELGKAAGEHEAQQDQGKNHGDNAGNVGGGSSGDFGGGDFGGSSSGDFGGDSSDIF